MNKDIIAKFDQYLAGEMKAFEKEAFEAELENSSELKSQFLEFKTIVDTMLELPQNDAVQVARKLKKRSDESYRLTFEAYEAGRLPSEQQKVVEDRLKADEWYAYQYEKFKKESIQSSSATVSQMEKAEPTAKVIQMRPKRLRYAIAAAILLLLSAFTAYLLRVDGTNSEELYAQYSSDTLLWPKPGFALVNEGVLHKGIIDSDDFVELKKEGLKAFGAEDWDTALNALSQYMEQAKPNEEETEDEINLINLYTGLAWLKKGETTKAIADLKKAEQGVVDEEDYRFLRESMRWHLALAHLKNKDVAAAKKLLNILEAATDEDIQIQAKNLLKDLE